MSEHSTEKGKGIFASPYYVLVVLMIGVFMMGLDSYVFSPALPTIVKDFGTSYDMVAWVATIYMLVSAVVMPLAGKLSDIYGRRNLFVAGIVLFTVGSLLSSLAWDIYALIAFRAVQAIGGGVILPAALATMGTAAPPDKRGKTIGTLMSMGALATIVGPNLGGYFIEHFGWRSVFYINVPIGILVVLMALMIRESYGNARHHVDIMGATMMGAGLAALVLGITRLGSLPLTDVTVFPLFAIAVLLGLLLYRYERRTPEPILDMDIMLKGDVLSLNVALMLLFFGMTCAVLFVSTYAQTVLNMSIQDSGSILTPRSVTIFLAGIVGGMLVDRFGHRIMLLAGSAILVIGMLGLTLWVNDAASLVVVLVLAGLGWGVGMGAFSVALLAITPGTEQGVTMGIMTTFRSVGGLIAPLIGGYFLNEALQGTVTYGQAFANLYVVATAAIAFAFALLAWFTFRTRKAVVPAETTAAN